MPVAGGSAPTLEVERNSLLRCGRSGDVFVRDDAGGVDNCRWDGLLGGNSPDRGRHSEIPNRCLDKWPYKLWIFRAVDHKIYKDEIIRKNTKKGVDNGVLV